MKKGPPQRAVTYRSYHGRAATHNLTTPLSAGGGIGDAVIRPEIELVPEALLQHPGRPVVQPGAALLFAFPGDEQPDPVGPRDDLVGVLLALREPGHDVQGDVQSEDPLVAGLGHGPEQGGAVHGAVIAL